MRLDHIQTIWRPTSVAEAHSLLTKHGKGARLLAGGVDLMQYIPPEVEGLIDLAGAGLSAIEADGRAFCIGATATLTELREHAASRDWLDGILVETLRQVASPLQRNIATIGGAIVSANPWSDVITLLLALDAVLVWFDGEAREVPIDEFVTQRGRLSGGILTEVRLPRPAETTAAAFRGFTRTAFDVALLNCACLVRMEGERCVEVRIALGGRPGLAVRLPDAEAGLVGGPLDDEAIARAAGNASRSADVRDDRRATAAYRRELAAVGVGRCLREVRTRSKAAA